YTQAARNAPPTNFPPTTAGLATTAPAKFTFLRGRERKCDKTVELSGTTSAVWRQRAGLYPSECPLRGARDGARRKSQSSGSSRIVPRVVETFFSVTAVPPALVRHIINTLCSRAGILETLRTEELKLPRLGVPSVLTCRNAVERSDVLRHLLHSLGGETSSDQLDMTLTQERPLTYAKMKGLVTFISDVLKEKKVGFSDFLHKLVSTQKPCQHLDTQKLLQRQSKLRRQKQEKAPSSLVNTETSQVKPSDFDYLKVIGTGSFGKAGDYDMKKCDSEGVVPHPPLHHCSKQYATT
ncbi:hypothetical protein CCH79_00007706, partial [Gambusia affinis]